MREALEGCNGLFLLTGYTVDMLAQSKRLLDAAQLAGVDQVVHVGVHGRPDTFVPHIGWHQYIERYIEHLGFSWTHLNPNWYLQNLLRFTVHEANGSLRVRNYLPAGLPLSSCAAHRSAVTARSPGFAAAKDSEVLTGGDSTSAAGSRVSVT